MPVTAMRAGDVIVRPQRFAHAHGHGLFAYIKVRQAGHQSARVEIVHLLFEQPDRHHPPVHADPLLGPRLGAGFAAVRCRFHLFTPAIFASTSKTTAKSYSARPIPRAAVRNSLVAAVVGSGTSTCRPSSSA